MGITTKNQLFIAEYLKDLNATQAAIRAGYSKHSARAQGCRLLTNADIKTEIDAQIAERVMSADEVKLRISDIARGDMADLMDITTSGFTLELMEKDENGELKVKDKTKLIKKIKQKVTTFIAKSESQDDREVVETEIELYSSQEALNTLAKHHGLLIDRTEITGKDGGAIPIEVFEKAVDKVYRESG
jgi:phage terminase small subunit